MMPWSKFLLLILGLLLLPGSVLAQLEEASVPAVAPEKFYRGEVVRIEREEEVDLGLPGQVSQNQYLQVRVTEGLPEEQVVSVQFGALTPDQRFAAGDQVVLIKPQDEWFIFDRYRLPALSLLAASFIGIAVVATRWRGLSSLAGLAVSVFILAFYLVPQIMDGKNPLLVSLLSAIVIAVISLYLAHGFTRRTSIAVGSTLISIVLAVGLAAGFVALMRLTGFGSEEAFYLRTSPVGQVNLKGLLLGGIIIGALGVLDDITTAQTATVGEIWRANPRLSRRALFQRGFIVGREHISSLINTLALAYVGSSLPTLLLFTVYQRPWWVVLNTETIVEEIVRTLVGSITLISAVPITTWLAVVFLTRQAATVTTPENNVGHQH